MGGHDQRAADGAGYRPVAVDHARQAAAHGAAYLEGIFARPSRSAGAPTEGSTPLLAWIADMLYMVVER